jgi:hypothetical protein
VITLPESRLAVYSGLYFAADRVALREIKYDAGHLQLSGINLWPLTNHEFMLATDPDVRLHFATSADGRPVELQIVTPMTAYRYARVEPFAPSAEGLSAYTGLYHSPELNVYWQLVLDGDQLLARHQRYADTRLIPVFADGFQNDWSAAAGYPCSYIMVFGRDAQGQINGFRLSDDRMRHLRFDRLR